jgi:hypothetical protein
MHKSSNHNKRVLHESDHIRPCRLIKSNTAPRLLHVWAEPPNNWPQQAVLKKYAKLISLRALPKRLVAQS